MKKLLKNKKGVTLIALVVTIVILIILAAVSMTMVLGENGILKQAQTAANAMVSAEINTQKGFESMSSEIDKILNGNSNSDDNPNNQTEEVIPGKFVEVTKKENYNDGQNKATVPAGFTVSGIESEQKIANGLVIYDIPKEELSTVNWNEDKDLDGNPDVRNKYNQFVWIPVKNENEYQRNLNYPSFFGNWSDTTSQVSTDVNYLPNTIEPQTSNAENNEIAERKAVLKYNGFYIARYETGKENTKTPVSKQNAVVWNSISQENAKTTSKLMYDINAVKTALCSGIQWDMAMKFVDGKQDAKENTFNVKVNEPKRHTGAKTNSGKNDNDKVQNIYDLEGNNSEYVAEKNNTKDSYISRGGVEVPNSFNVASLRNSLKGNEISNVGFRIVLYIM